MTDTHCHLDDARYADDLPEVLSRARQAGVTRMVTVGCDLATSRACVALAERVPGVWATVGVHPSECGKAAPEDLDAIARLAGHPRVVGIGECGLDFFRSGVAEPTQAAWLRSQIALARSLGKPLVIHCREAFPQTARILEEEGAASTGGVMHCFAGDADEIPPFTRLGFFVAFGGTATFPRNEKALRAAAACPEDRIVFETDAPYLAPQRWRGRRNEPAFIVEAARLVCDVRGVPYENLEETSDANAARLFAFAGAPQPA